MVNDVVVRKQNKKISIGLYINYFIHGIALIILAQNMTSLSENWATNIATVSFVISGVGIGRLIFYPISGFLSDHFARKSFVYLGMFSYLIFAIGMAFTKEIWTAYVFAIFAGCANSLLDSGTYTTLVEMHDGEGQGTVLLKAFMSAGEFILPIIVSFLFVNHFWYGWSFILMAFLLILNSIYLFPLKFPQQSFRSRSKSVTNQFSFSGKKVIMTIFLLFYGYTSMALMILFTQWITLYAQNYLNMSDLSAHFLLSLYSIGSIMGVIVLYFLLKIKISEINLMFLLNLLAVLSLTTIMFGNNNFFIKVACLLFGFAAAGGVMQTGLTFFMKLYPTRRGTITGSFYFFGSLASFSVPIITGFLAKTSVVKAFSLDLGIGIIGLIIVIVLLLCSRKEFK
ncbi:MFS transporter [Fructilactobacillus vespulae]|uniref:MFS transporter n=1 Tax=Fructilactobacillus vespulae TaxID=1249630 RepID=UPI0039B6A7B5